MLEKSKGIVLQSLKYGDSSLISHIYTEKFGRKSFIFKGIRSAKSKHKVNQIHPLIILNLDFYYKEQKDLLLVKEFSRAKIFNDFPFQPIKSSQSILLSEILSKTLLEESPDSELFDFLESSIEYFDLKKDKFANFHLSFLMKLTRFLGIYPKNNSHTENIYFDLIDACFMDHKPLHKNFADPFLSNYIFSLLQGSYELSSKIKLNKKLRNLLLDIILRFYSIHNYKIDNLKSKTILIDVFEG